MIRKFTLIIIITICALSSCRKDIIKGKGPVSERVINVSAFKHIETHYDIKAVITSGPTQELKAYGYENILDIIDFKVEDSTLKLKYNNTYNTVRNGKINAIITIPSLERVTIHGSNDIDIRNFLNGNSIEAIIHGSGSIFFNNSKYVNSHFQIHGSGHINGSGLEVKKALVQVHGSGNSYIKVSDTLKAEIWGSGNISYWGSPNIETVRNGSGKLIKK